MTRRLREIQTEQAKQTILATITDLQQIPLRKFCSEIIHLETSPLVGAIFDASEGARLSPEVDSLCETHFGCTSDLLPTEARRTVVIRGGGRGGKSSRCLAPKALHAAWTVPLPTLADGEIACSLIIAPDKRMARQTLSFVRGYVDESEVLRSALVKDPTAEEIVLRRPDGKLCSISVAAASRGGKGGRSKTLVFAGLDEACFFLDESTGVVNDTDIYRAVLQRVVPSGQVWVVSTPWVAGIGLLEDLLGKDYGSHVHALCATAPTRSLNPAWDPDGSIERGLREQDPDAAEREIDAIPLVSGTSHFFSYEAIKQSVRESGIQRLSPVQGAQYSFGGDCGFRRNSSALVVCMRDGERYRIADVVEIKPTPGLPLKPAGVVQSFAKVIQEYGGHELIVDSHERTEVATELSRHYMDAVDAPDKVEGYIAARKLIHEGLVDLPNNPRLIRQLRDVMGKPMPGGGINISSPRKADGSHGDLVSALVLALHRAQSWETIRSTASSASVFD